MQVSLSWLNQYVPVTRPVSEIADALTLVRLGWLNFTKVGGELPTELFVRALQNDFRIGFHRGGNALRKRTRLFADTGHLLHLLLLLMRRGGPPTPAWSVG